MPAGERVEVYSSPRYFLLGRAASVPDANCGTGQRSTRVRLCQVVPRIPCCRDGFRVNTVSASTARRNPEEKRLAVSCAWRCLLGPLMVTATPAWALPNCDNWQGRACHPGKLQAPGPNIGLCECAATGCPGTAGRWVEAGTGRPAEDSERRGHPERAVHAGSGSGSKAPRRAPAPFSESTLRHFQGRLCPFKNRPEDFPHAAHLGMPLLLRKGILSGGCRACSPTLQQELKTKKHQAAPGRRACRPAVS